MKDVIYFKHDVNAATDPRIARLRAKHGPVSYAFWWFTLEILRTQSDGKLPVDEYEVISMISGIEHELVVTFVDTCLSLGLFKTDGKCIWSDRLLRDIDHMHDKRIKASESGKLGGRPKRIKSESKANALQNESESKANQKQYSIVSTVQDSISSKKRDKETPAKAVPLSDIQKFLNDIPEIERDTCVRFIDYRKRIKNPILTPVGLKGFLRNIKTISEDTTKWPAIMDRLEEKEWVSVEYVKLEDLPSGEEIPIGYRLAAMKVGAKTDAEIRKIIPKFEGLQHHLIGMSARFWNDVDLRRLPELVRLTKVDIADWRREFKSFGLAEVEKRILKSIEKLT